jgi:hypothetical protein
MVGCIWFFSPVGVSGRIFPLRSARNGIAIFFGRYKRMKGIGLGLFLGGVNGVFCVHPRSMGCPL